MLHAQSLPSPTSDGWVWKILGPFPHMQLQAQMAEKDPPPPTHNLQNHLNVCLHAGAGNILLF